MRLSLSSSDRLKSRKLIEKLFSEGQAKTVFPIKCFYIITEANENSGIKAGFTVSKRNFKSAVHRNRIKRLLREAYRLNRKGFFNNNTTDCALMFLYIGKDKPTFKIIESAMIKLLESLHSELISTK